MAWLAESAAMAGAKKIGGMEQVLVEVGRHCAPPIFDVSNGKLIS